MSPAASIEAPNEYLTMFEESQSYLRNVFGYICISHTDLSNDCEMPGALNLSCTNCWPSPRSRQAQSYPTSAGRCTTTRSLGSLCRAVRGVCCIAVSKILQPSCESISHRKGLAGDSDFGLPFATPRKRRTKRQYTLEIVWNQFLLAPT